MEILKIIITNILTALYQPFCFRSPGFFIHVCMEAIFEY